MAAITLDRVKVIRSGSTILDVDHLQIADGELLVVLGPSGAGKSTLLRAVAGLDSISTGVLRFGGQDMANVAIPDRGVAMVFQDHSLYPFLDVRGNVGFPLKLRRTPPAEITARVEAEARVLAIEHLLDRKPKELGAGHQQLVQAARALVRVPDVFLMDEPFARLDARLRLQVRQEFRLLQQGYGVTTLFVTNDQEEAMVMADRVAVIDCGTIRQVGPPLELYQRPVDTFVAGFIGSISFFDARVTADAPGFWVEFGGHRVRAWMPALGRVSGDSVTVGIRPEDIVMDPAGMTVGVGRGSFLGSHGLAQVELAPGATVEMRTEGPCPPAGSEVKIRLCRLHIFDPRTGIALGRVEGGAS